MSDINSQNQINVIASLKEQSIGTKNSLEQINRYLQEIHKNVLKETSPKNDIKSIDNEKEGNEKNKENKEDIKNYNIIEEKKESIESINEKVNEDKKSDNKEDEHSIKDSELNDNTDEVSNININKIKNSNYYKVSNDINIINSIAIQKKNSTFKNKENADNPQKIENVNNNIINDNKKEEKKSKNREYVYKDKDEITESSINPEELMTYNISQGSELYLNDIIAKLGGDENSSIKEETLNNLSKENINENENRVLNIIKEIDSDSVKIDSNEVIKLGLTNIPITDDKDNTSLITNELNKACIRTNDNIKSKDYISNIESDIQREEEKEENGKEIRKFSKRNTKNSNNINIINDKVNNLEIIFNKEESQKDQNVLIEETKKEIYNEINNMYESKLNLVKINNKEKYSYITKYNDPDKEKFGYESDYFYCNKNSNNFLNRRNNFLQHKYFSYILSKKEKINNNINNENNEKKEKIKNKNKDKKKDDSIDSIDNFEYIPEEINKFKKNYNEKIEPMEFNLNFIRANSPHDNIKEYKINDIEDMTSFYYYFNLYSPEEDFKKVLDDETENEIVSCFTTYRKVLNDVNSFKRAFSYLLLENFILQNKVKKLDFIIHDIKKVLSNKFKDIKNICNILIDIKENSSIDYLMNSYNNPNYNFDEVMITYIEDTIKNVLGVESTKRKYQEIDFNVLRILANVFDVNLEIYYIEEDDNNKLLKMKKLVVLNDIFLQAKKNIKSSNYSECESSTTFRLLFFLNSFYIVYTKKSDIDSTLANNNTERQYYYVSSLPKYKCPNCKKCTGLDIIPSNEAIFCHICLNKHLQIVLEKRAILYVKSNFSCIEYYTRPIKITSDIIITGSLYKYITKNYIINDFEKIVERICFKCFEKYEKEKIKKLKCMCQLCENCLEKLLKENIKDKVYLNKYELNTLNRTKCLCQNEVDIINLMKLSKNQPTENDIKRAEERLVKKLKTRCCLCQEKDKFKLLEIKIISGPPHFICLKCYEKLSIEDKSQNIENKNEINNDLQLSEYESNDTAIKEKDKDKEKNIVKKKFYCEICFERHTSIEDYESETQHKNIIDRVVQYGEGKFKCCKGKCSIF